MLSNHLASIGHMGYGATCVRIEIVKKNRSDVVTGPQDVIAMWVHWFLCWVNNRIGQHTHTYTMHGLLGQVTCLTSMLTTTVTPSITSILSSKVQYYWSSPQVQITTYQVMQPGCFSTFNVSCPKKNLTIWATSKKMNLNPMKQKMMKIIVQYPGSPSRQDFAH